MVRLVGFVPEEEVSDGAAVVVTHGGTGRVLTVLSRRVPLVVIPEGADQLTRAERSRQHGVLGLALWPGRSIASRSAEC